jgi:hypothetical protein
MTISLQRNRVMMVRTCAAVMAARAATEQAQRGEVEPVEVGHRQQ